MALIHQRINAENTILAPMHRGGILSSLRQVFKNKLFHGILNSNIRGKHKIAKKGIHYTHLILHVPGYLRTCYLFLEKTF